MSVESRKSILRFFPIFKRPISSSNETNVKKKINNVDGTNPSFFENIRNKFKNLMSPKKESKKPKGNVSEQCIDKIDFDFNMVDEDN